MLGENPTEAQHNAIKDARKREPKALFYIQQCLDSPNFGKVAKAVSSKASWDKLTKCYQGEEG